MTATRSPGVRSEWLLVALVVVAGTGMSLWLGRSVFGEESTRDEVLFSRQVETRHALIRQTLADYEECLLAMRVLMTHGGEVDQEKFSRVARAQLARFPGFLGVQWAPRVPAAARAQWEQAHAAVLGELGRVRQRAATGPDVVAGEREEYFPVLFVEPFGLNRHVIGTDATASPLRSVFATAAASRAPAMSGLLKLVYESGSNDGVILACPVWTEADEEAGAGAPRGFLLGVFRVADLLVQPWNRAPSTQLDVMFVDESATRPDRRVLYCHLAGGDGRLPTEEEFQRAPHRRMQLPIPGRTWSVLYRRGVDRVYGANLLPAVALGAGLIVTALAASLLLLQIRRARTVERLVQERTAELSESRRQLDALMQAIPGIVFRGVYRDVMDLNFVSAGVKDLTGYEAKEILAGQVRWRDLVHAEDLRWVRSQTRAAIEQGRDFQVEYRIRTRDGGQKWMLARGRGLKPADRGPPVVEGLAIDITAQKEAETGRLALERKLLQGQKLESLGLLAGGLAHDFNNLLSTMLGNAELGQLTVPAGHSAGAKFRSIELAATHAAELCRQLLSYAGKGRLVVEPLDLSALLEGMRPLLKVSATPRARVRLELSRDLPAVEADPTQIRQIVMNLMMNAADALPPEGGEVLIRTERVQVTEENLRSCVTGTNLRPGEYVALEVRDNGAGMAPEVCARIFDPFFTTKPTGRGLGLSAVLGIVRGHGGGLCVRSAPGRGSSFHLLLPPAPSATSVGAARAAPGGGAWWHNGRALVVDDQPEVRAVMAEMLRGFGFAPEEHADGREALAALQANPAGIALVVLDLLMPGLGGEATLAALRVSHPVLPVLLMSGYTEYDLAPHLAAGSGVRFLAKPFTRATLERELRALFA